MEWWYEPWSVDDDDVFAANFFRLLIERGYSVADVVWAGPHIVTWATPLSPGEPLSADEMRPNVHVDYFLDQLDKVLNDNDQS